MIDLKELEFKAEDCETYLIHNDNPYLGKPFISIDEANRLLRERLENAEKIFFTTHEITGEISGLQLSKIFVIGQEGRLIRLNCTEEKQ
jgi:hypothetical protein